MTDQQTSRAAASDQPVYSGKAVSIGDLEQAADRIRGEAIRTPLLTHPLLDARTGAQVFIKPENLQRTGSFKFRGAYNRLNAIPEAERSKGVVACSSGNHAQGVAQSARLLAMPASIVMPADAPAIKLDRTRQMGAKVITYDRAHEDREAIAARLCAETGATFVHPYNDPHVIAGQGTVGLEIARQSQDMGVELDDVLACTGGGGLSSGIALALAYRSPGTRFHTVEPEDFNDYARSLEAGALLSNEIKSGSVCDALLAETPGEIGFSILRQFADTGLTVSDEDVLQAVAFAYTELKLVVEPGGAAALAAVLSGKLSLEGRRVAVVLTGGNMDPAMLQRALAG